MREILDETWIVVWQTPYDSTKFPLEHEAIFDDESSMQQFVENHRRNGVRHLTITCRQVVALSECQENHPPGCYK